MKDQDKKRSTAFHESGHACACYLLDGGLGFATVRPTADTGGMCWCETTADMPLLDRLSIDLAGQLASSFAEHGTFARYQKPGASGDWDHIERSILRSNTEGHALMEAFDRCCRLLKHNWSAVEAVAERLLQDKHLSGRELAEIIKKHTRRAW